MAENEPPPQRSIGFDREFLEDLANWMERDRKVALRLVSLMRAIIRDPVTGIGNPELLRHLPGNTWSRRLTSEHRITYLVTEGRIDFLQARYHY